MECCVGADNKGNGIQGEPLGVIIPPGVVEFERSSEGGGEEEQSARAFIAWHGGMARRRGLGTNTTEIHFEELKQGLKCNFHMRYILLFIIRDVRL